MNVFDQLTVILSTIVLLILVSILAILFVISHLKRLTRETGLLREVEEDFKKRLEEFVREEVGGQLSLLTDSYRKLLSERSLGLYQKMEKETVSQIKNLEVFVKEQEGLITKQIEEAVGRIVKKAEDDIESYKRSQLEGIDVVVGELVEKISKEVLGKAITLSDHQDLVLEALNRAKDEGIFSHEMMRDELKREKGRSKKK